MKVDLYRMTAANLGKKKLYSYLVLCIRVDPVEGLPRKHEVLRSPLYIASSVSKPKESGSRGTQWHRISFLDECADQSSI